MPRAPTNKVLRVTQFLNGLRSTRARALMAARGFTQKDADEGTALMKTCNQLNMGVVAPTADPELISKIDAVENEWFPLASAALKRRFPEVHEVVFLNLAQTEGFAVVSTVGVFARRVRDLEASPDPKHQEARKVLAERGLTESKLLHIESLLAAVSLPETTELPAPDLEDPAEAYKAVDEALWAWFLEWSQVARIAIKDRRLLRSMGFLKPARNAADGEDEADDEPSDDGAKPAPPEGQKPAA